MNAVPLNDERKGGDYGGRETRNFEGDCSCYIRQNLPQGMTLHRKQKEEGTEGGNYLFLDSSTQSN